MCVRAILVSLYSPFRKEKGKKKKRPWNDWKDSAPVWLKKKIILPDESDNSKKKRKKEWKSLAKLMLHVYWMP